MSGEELVAERRDEHQRYAVDQANVHGPCQKASKCEDCEPCGCYSDDLESQQYVVSSRAEDWAVDKPTIRITAAPASKVNNGKPLTLAVFSCSQFQAGNECFLLKVGQFTLSFSGYFNAYGVAAHNTTADIFVHLGDYVSETV